MLAARDTRLVTRRSVRRSEKRKPKKQASNKDGRPEKTRGSPPGAAHIPRPFPERKQQKKILVICTETSPPTTRRRMSNNNNVGGATGDLASSAAAVGNSFGVFVKQLTGKAVYLQCLPSDKVRVLMLKIQDSVGVPPDVQRLIFEGIQLAEHRALSRYGITNDSTIHLLLRLAGMISTFTSSDIGDPLVAFLMLSDEERASVPVPIQQLRKKAKRLCAHPSCCFEYNEDPKILHHSQRDLLCRLLDFVWSKTASDNADRVDMRLSLSDSQFLALMGYVDSDEEPSYDSSAVLQKLQGAFTRVPGSLGRSKIVFG